MSRRSLQISLSSIPLIVLAISTWLAALRFQLVSTELRRDVARMEQLQPQTLEVTDPDRLVAVERYPTWYDEHIWDVFLPGGCTYQLNLATHDIDESGLAPVAHSFSLSAGRHTIEIVSAKKVQGRWYAEVRIDGRTRIRVDEPLEWNLGSGSSGAGSSVQPTSPEGDSVLFRRRWVKKKTPTSYATPNVPSEGLLLWIHGSSNSDGN